MAHVDTAKLSAARHGGISIRTAERWLARYCQDGLAGLVRATRSDADAHRLRADLVAVIEGMGLTKPRTSAAAIHRRIGNMAKAEAEAFRDLPAIGFDIRGDPGAAEALESFLQTAIAVATRLAIGPYEQFVRVQAENHARQFFEVMTASRSPWIRRPAGQSRCSSPSKKQHLPEHWPV